MTQEKDPAAQKPAKHEPRPNPHPHVITYFLDGEPQEATDPILTVEEILRRGGLDPATHCLVEIRGSQQIEHKDLNEEIRVHPNQKFISVFCGATPVS